MPRRTSFPSRAVRARRPATSWGRVVSASQITIPAASKVLVGTFGLFNDGISEVVRRTRGTYLVSSDQTTAYEFQFGSMGFIVATSVAIAAGVASLPGPVTEANDDGWFVWEPFTQLSQATEAGSTHDGISTIRNFDSKAMRRIDQGFGVAVVVENSHATHGFEFAFAFSLLASRT